MKLFHSKTLFTFLTLIAAIAFLHPANVVAQEEPTREVNGSFLGQEILVTATRTAIPYYETGSSVSVITGEEMEKRGKKTVADALRDLPGVTLTQNAPFGGLTSLYIRGSNPGKVLVLIDGIEQNDPISTDRLYNFAYLTADNIEKIEVIRGSQSTLYGSDAMGGVINIITRTGKGKPRLEASAEAGSYNTFRESAGLSGSFERLNYNFFASRTDSKGFSSAAKADNALENPEKDRYAVTNLSSKIGINPFGKSWLNLSVRYNQAKVDIDDGIKQDDPNRYNKNKDLNTKAEYVLPLFGWLEEKVAYSYYYLKREDRDPADSVDTTEDSYNCYKGYRRKGEWQQNVYFGKINTLTLGAEHETESGQSSVTYVDWTMAYKTTEFEKKSLDNNAAYIQNHLKLWKMLFITAGGRVDKHDLFGTNGTYRASASLLVPQTGTRFRGSYGTGFKAPSLYQLYDASNGNLDLKAEKSVSYDYGLDQEILKDRIVAGATYHHTLYRDMIDWVELDPMNFTGKYFNKDKAETKGVEATLSIIPIDDITLKGSYTYLLTEDKTTGEALLRRPKHQGNLNINWSFLKRGNINAAMLYVGKRWDNNEKWPAERVKMPSYTRYDLAASWQLIEQLRIFGKVENLTDKKYQELYGYNTPERSYYAGLKAVL